MMVAALVADIGLWKKTLCAMKRRSLIRLAVDESQPHCIDDGERVWWEGLQGDQVCFSMMGSKGWYTLHDFLCSPITYMH